MFKRGDQDSKMKDITFKKAYCVKYAETFDARGGGAQASMVLSLVISADEVNVNGATHKHNWV